jgi:hypothetical protein
VWYLGEDVEEGESQVVEDDFAGRGYHVVGDELSETEDQPAVHDGHEVAEEEGEGLAQGLGVGETHP